MSYFKFVIFSATLCLYSQVQLMHAMELDSDLSTTEEEMSEEYSDLYADFNDNANNANNIIDDYEKRFCEVYHNPAVSVLSERLPSCANHPNYFYSPATGEIVFLNQHNQPISGGALENIDQRNLRPLMQLITINKNQQQPKNKIKKLKKLKRKATQKKATPRKKRKK